MGGINGLLMLTRCGSSFHIKNKKKKECTNLPPAVPSITLLMLLYSWIRFEELKNFYGIEDNRASVGPTGPQKLSSGLICTSES